MNTAAERSLGCWPGNGFAHSVLPSNLNVTVKTTPPPPGVARLISQASTESVKLTTNISQLVWTQSLSVHLLW